MTELALEDSLETLRESIISAMNLDLICICGSNVLPESVKARRCKNCYASITITIGD